MLPVVFYLLIIGFISILGQVVILRELNVAFFGVELIYILALAVWMLGSAIGAALGRRDFLPALSHISLLWITFAILLPLDAAFIRGSRVLFGGVPGAYLSFFQQMVLLALALFPVSFLPGLLFQWAARRYVAGGKTLARAYAIESAGGLAGGLAATLLLKLGVQNFSIALLCSFVSLGAFFLYRDKKASRFILAGGLAVAAIILLAGWKSSAIDRRLSAWNHPFLVVSRDTPYSRVTITARGGQVAVFENDALTFESEGTAAEEFVHLAMLQRPDPQTVLVLGGGGEGIITELLYHPLQQIDYVELNRVWIDLARNYLPEDIRQSLQAGNLRIIFADPRKFLRVSRASPRASMAPPEERPAYDVILVSMPEPASGQANRFYTREFFEQCAARLNPGGILAFRLRSAENLWSPQLARRNGSIFRALASVFPETVVLPGVTNLFIASPAPLERNPEILGGRLAEKNLPARMVTPPYVRYLYTNDRFSRVAEVLAKSPAPVNSDARPVCYQYTIAIWLSKFFPALAQLDLSPSGRAGKYMLLFSVAAIILLLLARRKLALRRMALAGIAGFLGMVTETLVILQYQVHHGVLYQNIGILLMAFMGGLALGAFATEAYLRNHSGNIPRLRRTGMGLSGGFVLANLLFAAGFGAEMLRGLLSAAILLGIAGFLVAGIFSLASLYRVENRQAVISPLYSADLAGGCAGSILASLVLIPLAGLAGSAYLTAAMAAAAALLLW